MRVHPSQLTEGCVLIKNVQGKSGRPIMKENTVLTKEHIIVLHKFLIDSVEVSAKLADGKRFVPKEQTELQDALNRQELYLTADEERSFPAHYLQVVRDYKQFFTNWKSGTVVDIAKVRQSIIPLLERIEELDIEIFTLHQYVTSEDYMYHHAVAVSLLSAFLGKELGYRKGEWIQIGLAGYLSDIGMSKVDPEIMTKGDPLTDKQLQDIRNHPTYSYRMVENITGLSQQAKLGILQHHERMDGSGYPLGVEQDKINMFARIIAVCDTYHAMTSEKLYKGKQPIFRVVGEIAREQFTKLDMKIVQRFIGSLTKYSVGKTVHLTNKKTGEIVFYDEQHPTRPLVRIHDTGEIISLQMNPDVHIDEIVID